MKILLIYPRFIEDRKHDGDIRVPPMGIYNVAAVLRENHYDVEILNWHDLDTPDHAEEVLREKSPHIIGFSILNGNRWGGIEIARIAKRLNSRVKVIFGGIGATFLWEHLLTHFPEIDFIVMGEGEYGFLELVSKLEAGNDSKLETIQGVALRKNGKILKTDQAPPIEDLDKLPIPARYFTYEHVSSSRGCPWDCAFCGSPGYWGGRIRFRSPRHFVDELELLYNRGIRFFYFSDDTFTIKKDRVIEICKGIIQRGMHIEWYAISRVNHVDEDILLWMRKAGCIQISYGIESGSEKIRHLLHKKIETDRIVEAFTRTTHYGILSRAYFIYGCPGEGWDTIQETIDLIHRIKPLGAVFYILDLFPGTALYEDFKIKSGVTDDVWLNKIEGILYGETDSRLSDEIILSFGRKLRSDYYKSVHAFADNIELADREDLYPFHADFCSRLGMTFSHGDYSHIDQIRDKDRLAEKLFRKSLSYHADHRAYLGLGILKQKAGEYGASIALLTEGLGFFQDSESLNMCMGVSLMNVGEYPQALIHFSRCPDSKEAGRFIA
ncbi:MAG: radical SAM protein, partial [Deltaproteobacteria bacterium]|nr:radical SAM protein [Deltaproteobacteria bacterium]